MIVLRITLKELKIYFSDWKAVFLFLIMPIILITLFALAFGDVGKGKDKGITVKLPIVINDSSATSQMFIDSLAGRKEMRLEYTSYDEGCKRVKDGERAAVLVVHKGLEDSLKNDKPLPIELLYDEAKDLQLGLIKQALVTSYFNSIGLKSTQKSVVQTIRKSNPLMNPIMLAGIEKSVGSQFQALLGNDENTLLGSSVTLTKLVKQKQTPIGLVQAVSGVAVLMLLFQVIILGMTINDEKERGTLKRLVLSPIQPYSILAGKMLTMIIFSMVQLVVMFAFSSLAFGLSLKGHYISIFVLMLSTSFACTGLGAFLASLATSRRQIESLSIITILVISAIGGSMIPLYIMPDFMQKLAMVSLNYWSIQGFFDIFWREMPFIVVFLKSLVLLFIGAVFTAFAIFFYKKNILNINS